MSVTNSGSSSLYVCPLCKGALQREDQSLSCPACKVDYPVVGGIPNFIWEDLAASGVWLQRELKLLDWLARIYETGLWYTPVLKIYGGRSAPTFKQLIRIVMELMTIRDGVILDAACGPGTWGRRIAPQSKEVYGIDISWGMLRRGLGYALHDHISNVHFVRSKVETLPFPDACFDAAFCGGALHLLPDTVAALREIGRTMRPGSPLVVLTFIVSDQGVLRFKRAREHVEKDHGFHIFELPELEGYLAAAGFEGFKPQVYGGALAFTATKG